MDAICGRFGYKEDLNIWRFTKKLVCAVKRLFQLPFQHLAQRSLAKERYWIELRIAGRAVEIEPKTDWRAALRARMTGRKLLKTTHLSQLRDQLSLIAKDDRVDGLLVRIDSLEMGWADAEQIRVQLKRFKEAARKSELIVYTGPQVGNLEFFIASVGGLIWMPEMAMITAAGPAVRGLYLKSLLDDWGLGVQAINAGRYKSAPERFTRSERSEADREQITALVRVLDSHLTNALLDIGDRELDDPGHFLSATPMHARLALEHGWIDALIPDEAVLSQLTEIGDPKSKVISASRYERTFKTRPIWPKNHKKVGVLPIEGMIVDQSLGFGGRKEVSAAQVTARARALAEDDRVAAVLLYVNSPGGSASAAESMFHAIHALNDAKKPVTAYFANVAASGGYYAGMAAEKIVASPLCLTGSIGVFSMFPNWAKLSERLQLGRDSVVMRESANFFDPYRELSEEEIRKLTEVSELSYEIFLERVLVSRKQDYPWVNERANGRVWIGEEAKAQGLVDALGGFDKALRLAKDSCPGVTFDEAPYWCLSEKAMPRPARVDEGHSEPDPGSHPDASLRAWLAQPALKAFQGRPELDLLLELWMLTQMAAKGPTVFAYDRIELH